ncbi:iron ABC transporter permease [Phenylobacterium sp. LH3H17]|uniref:FecCD family ABC transporter permease n=1 Tax=Phenylobacterium sp. LH3H17 TaxID=2903901 RepID=UPI0020C9C9C1|nr:iron ABC transporter permease [Phenylobacterium sp. LH3H17]UTP40447.1 iron ABC transporter permease [Phenylobacterium sp. LH3H17]
MNRRALTLAVLVSLAVLLALVSMAAGRLWVPFADWADTADPRSVIILELRLPRTLLCVAVGAALGMSGAAMQGYTRNPLADPGALGVSSMAALGAVLTLYLGAGASQPWVIAAAAMTGALIAVFLLLALSGQASSIVTFLLAGVILQTVAGAGVALALSLAPNPWAVNEIVNWLMGSLADRGMAEVQMVLPLIAVGCLLLLLIGRGLDALTLGETGARSLGINMTATRWLLAIGVALTAGASVAVTGVIGFVGLIVPHLLRPLVGARPGGLLIPSAIGGAVLVLAADIAVRLAPAAGEVKLGVAMAVLGGPFFFALLLSLRKRIA